VDDKQRTATTDLAALRRIFLIEDQPAWPGHAKFYRWLRQSIV